MAGYSVTYSVVDNATKQIDAINKRIAAMRAPMDRMSRSVSRFVDVSGLRKVATGFESIFKAAGSVLRTLTAIVPVMGALTGAASIAGMVKLVESYSNWAHELVQTADNLGMTTQEVQQLQNATRLAGGNADDMTNALKSLYSAANDARRGMPETAAWFNRLGIAWNDSNGHLRSMSDLLPEVMRKIAAMPNADDRARASAALLGDGNLKLIETFRQSSQSFAQWFADASRYKSLTDEQKRTLQAFTEAQGRSGVAFDQLGQQISITLAKNFTPLINHLTDFVEKNTPAILKAVDDLSKRFASWLENINWQKVQDGIDSVIGGLKWMIDHLDTIVRVAEDIAILFAVKWGVGIVANVATVIAALAPLAAALAPIAAALTLISSFSTDAAIKAAEESEAKKKGFEKRGGSLWNPFDKIPHWVNPQTGEDITEEEMRRRLGADPGRGFSPLNMPNAGAPATTPPATGGGWLERGANWLFGRAMKGPDAIQPPKPIQQQSAPGVGALPGDYSWGDYGTRANNPGNLNYASWENASGKFDYTDPHTGGAHTMAVFKSMQEGVAASVELMKRNQAKYGNTLAGALHGWAENPYVDKLGMDPNAPFDVSKADPDVLANLLQSQYKREGRAGSHTATREQILEGIARSRAPLPADVPFDVPTRPPNGTVDVSITHKNPPPNSAVTATGSGNVNVAPVRVEQQDMASI
jgi:hypothetical protein